MIYRADYILPIAGDPIKSGQVRVTDGRIEAVGTDLAAPGESVIDLGHAALLPGFVDVHTHLDYTITRGLFDNEDFFPWIRRLTEVASGLQYDDFLASSRLGALQLVRSGVTTIGDSTFSGAAAEAAAEAGLRGIIYQEAFGPDPSADYREQVEDLVEKIHDLRSRAGDGIAVGVSPHSIYTSSEPLLKLIAGLARDEGLPVAIHVSETLEEMEFLEKGTGPIAEFYGRLGIEFAARSITPVSYLHDIGILGSRTVAAHCVHVTDADLDILGQEEVRIAHCPKSNAKLGVGMAPLAGITGRGIVTGLGTDSAASDNAADMFEEMRFAVLVQRAAKRDVQTIDAARILRMATLGGAEALGMEAETGSIEPGKRADLIAVDLSAPSALPSPDPVSAIVYSCSSADVLLSMIGGEVVYRDGRFTRVDSDEVIARAGLVASKL